MKRLLWGLFALLVIAALAFTAYWLQIRKLATTLDFNGNGTLEVEEAGAAQKPNFHKFDLNGDGSLQNRELMIYAASSLKKGWRVKRRLAGMPDLEVPASVTGADVQAALDHMVKVLELPGAVLMQGGTGQVWVSGDLTPDTRVPVASASKWISSVVLMRLVEQSLLSLDEPIGRYLGDLEGPWRNVTLRQLLSFSAGAQEGHVLGVSPEEDYGEVFAELVAQELHNSPGAEFTYGGITLQIAGYLAEQVTGKSWDTLFQEQVAAPLGMTRSQYFHPIFFKDGVVVRAPNIAAGLHTTARDYLSFLTAVAAPTPTLLSQASIETIETDYTSGLIQNSRPPGVRENWSYGLGLWCERDIQNRCARVNSAGAYGTFPWVNRATGEYGVLVTVGSIREVSQFAVHLRALLEAM